MLPAAADGSGNPGEHGGRSFFGFRSKLRYPYPRAKGGGAQIIRASSVIIAGRGAPHFYESALRHSFSAKSCCFKGQKISCLIVFRHGQPTAELYIAEKAQKDLSPGTSSCPAWPASSMSLPRGLSVYARYGKRPLPEPSGTTLACLLPDNRSACVERLCAGVILQSSSILETLGCVLASLAMTPDQIELLLRRMIAMGLPKALLPASDICLWCL